MCSQKHEIYYQNVQQYEASEVVSAMSNVNEARTAVVNVPALQIYAMNFMTKWENCISGITKQYALCTTFNCK